MSIIVIVLAMLASPMVSAIPAFPDPITVVQPDGSRLSVIVRGDEFFNYTTTLSGQTIVRQSDGFYYFAKYSASGIEISNVKVISSTNIAGAGAITKGVGSKIDSYTISALRSESPMLRNMEQTKSSKALIQPKRGLIILVEYSDVAMRTPNAHSAFDKMSNSTGYNHNGATGSAKEYFKQNSNGKYDPVFDVYGPYKLNKPMSHYGENDSKGSDKRPREMIIDACEAANGDVDFGLYDANGDGEIDMVYVYYAGYSEAEAGPKNAIWPHKWSAAQLSRSFDGKRVGVYACSNELRGSSGTIFTGVGTFCHEYSHVLGLMDMYDTDGDDNGKGAGLGTISIMAAGSYNNNGNTPPYFNIFEREELGWVKIPNLTAEGTVKLLPVHKDGGYRIPSSTAGEYFILEYRDGNGWDGYILRNSTTKGMLVYRVDKESNRLIGSGNVKKMWVDNMVNSYADHQCMQIRPAAGTFTDFPTSAIFFPGGGKVTELLPTNPNMKDWNNVPIGVSLTSIALNSDHISFIVGQPSNYRKFSGSVYGNNGVGLKGATVKIVPVVKSKSGGVVVRSISQVDGDGEAIAITNDKGEFAIANGAKDLTYDVVVSAVGYNTKFDQIVMDVDVTKIYELTRNEMGLQTRVTHAYPIEQKYLSTDKNFAISHKYTVEHIKKLDAAGKRVNAVYFHSNKSSGVVNITIKMNNVVFAQWESSVGVGMNVVQVPRAVIIGNNDVVDLIVEFEQGQYVVLDKGPAVSGYGDLIKIGADSWTTLSKLAINSNTCIGMWVDKTDARYDEPVVEVVDVLQREFTINFFSPDANIDEWIMKVGVDDNEKVISLPSSQNRVTYTNLTPNSTYNIEVTSVSGSKKISTKTSVKTSQVTAPFAAISLPDVITTSGEFVPKLTNLNKEIKSVVWKLDGVVKNANSFAITSVGDHKIEVDITWSDNTKEFIVKKVNVIK